VAVVSTSFDFDEPDHFTTGAVGEPGHRVFYLQAAQQGSVATLRLEKQQVVVLAEYLAGLLELPEGEGTDPVVALIEPVLAEWVVGSLAVAYEEADGRVLLVAEELVLPPDDDADTDDPLEAIEAIESIEAVEPATARFHLTHEQAVGFIRRTTELVASGRPACALCGRPIDPEGHACPKLN
jgi:uncharacterized repeat protein (TIGR03847 family)